MHDCKVWLSYKGCHAGVSHKPSEYVILFPLKQKSSFDCKVTRESRVFSLCNLQVGEVRRGRKENIQVLLICDITFLFIPPSESTHKGHTEGILGKAQRSLLKAYIVDGQIQSWCPPAWCVQREAFVYYRVPPSLLLLMLFLYH